MVRGTVFHKNTVQYSEKKDNNDHLDSFPGNRVPMHDTHLSNNTMLYIKTLGRICHKLHVNSTLDKHTKHGATENLACIC